ncbi:MAG TPA: SidA/IucD/PvdA family monooxygenase [Nocardioidaceae bacterium]|nr:SidA/IucD/PvdA family monooxygenase [Nocardioidaceae bacterium]
MSRFDVVGVGLGPFNLGLAALVEPIENVTAAFFEAEREFSWHPGLMLPGARLQVPFLADLVTLTDPTSRYSFLSYLHERDRLYRFYFYERFHVPRQEFESYARWVAERLSSCRFGWRVDTVRPDAGGWIVRVRASDGSVEEHHARHVVFGVGSRPSVPRVAREHLGDGLFHAAEYRTYREKAVTSDSVTVVGSGQSAGEVVADLLETGLGTGMRLDWFTRSRGFFPMEYSKLGLEHFTPDYLDYFYRLRPDVRDELRAGQDLLYKGLSAETSERIYDLLYEATIDRDDPPVTYVAGCELAGVEPSPEPGRRWRLTWHHRDDGRTFARDTDVVVLATGHVPATLPIEPELIARDGAGRPEVTPDYRLQTVDGCPTTLFVQNAELHTHGVGAPDLGLGAHRNAVIVNALTGQQTYRVSQRTAFQRFGSDTLTDARQEAR